jgi:acyl-coenzyme A thioesterase PaaI-like protein
MLKASFHEYESYPRYNVIQIYDKSKKLGGIKIFIEVKTHRKGHAELLGKPVFIEDGRKSVVELVTTEIMVVDEYGLIHGGFAFSLADYSAMLAVNDPFVVLGSAEIKFTAPVKLGDVMRSEAIVVKTDGRRWEIKVEVKVGEITVLKGLMVCHVLQRHVLQK